MPGGTKYSMAQRGRQCSAAWYAREQCLPPRQTGAAIAVRRTGGVSAELFVGVKAISKGNGMDIVGIARTQGTFRGPQATPRASTEAEEARPASEQDQGQGQVSEAGRQQGRDTSSASQAGSTPGPTSARELDTAEQRAVEALRQRDREVRLHEQAHLLTAGPFAQGGPRYTYETGPDGQRYAVGGEVPIDLSSVPGDPEATIQKALTIRRAALAPAEPSGPDLAVAAKAATLAAQAQQELTQLQATRSASAGGDTAVNAPGDQNTASTTLAPHACGPNCQEHGIRSSTEDPRQGRGNPASAGVPALRALEQYQLVSRAL